MSLVENQIVRIIETPISSLSTTTGEIMTYVDETGKAKFISPTNPLPIKTNSYEISEYSTIDMDESLQDITYIGKQKNNGLWLVTKIDETNNLSIRYSNESNNDSYTDYLTAWGNRTTLNYDYIENLTSL